jgi:hypothetical protein
MDPFERPLLHDFYYHMEDGVPVLDNPETDR